MGSIIPRGNIVKYGESALNLDTIEYFTDNEIDAIVELMSRPVKRYRKFNRERYYLLMKVLLRTGARRSEALALTSSDFDLQMNTIKLITLKQKHKTDKKKNVNDDKPPVRILPLHPDLRDTFMQYVLEHSPKKDERIFPMSKWTVSHFFEAMSDELNFKVHVHKFRHTFAVRSLQSGVPLNVVQKWLGHSSIFTTSVYTNITGMDTQNYMAQVK